MWGLAKPSSCLVTEFIELVCWCGNMVLVLSSAFQTANMGLPEGTSPRNMLSYRPRQATPYLVLKSVVCYLST